MHYINNRIGFGKKYTTALKFLSLLKFYRSNPKVIRC